MITRLHSATSRPSSETDVEHKILLFPSLKSWSFRRSASGEVPPWSDEEATPKKSYEIINLGRLPVIKSAPTVGKRLLMISANFAAYVRRFRKIMALPPLEISEKCCSRVLKALTLDLIDLLKKIF